MPSPDTTNRTRPAEGPTESRPGMPSDRTPLKYVVSHLGQRGRPISAELAATRLAETCERTVLARIVESIDKAP
jgi:hypothetical protein